VVERRFKNERCATFAVDASSVVSIFDESDQMVAPVDDAVCEREITASRGCYCIASLDSSTHF